LRIDTIPIKIFNKDEIKFNFNKKEASLYSVLNQKEIDLLIDSLKSVHDSIRSQHDSLANKIDSAKIDNDSTNINRKSTDLETKNRSSLQKKETNRNIGKEARPSSDGQNIALGSTNQSTNNYTLQLYLGQGAFIGIESDSTANSSTNITFKKAEDYGTIKGKVEGIESDYIIQLLSEKYEVIDTLINKNEYQFNYVEPGSYRLRLIEDTNGNAKWDAGDPLNLSPHENIYYLDEVITVKANWEVIDKDFDISVDKSVNESEEN